MSASVNIGLALLLTTGAGISTGVGSAIAYFIKNPKMTYLAFSLGFSAGVMIYISFVELMPQATIVVGEVRSATAFFLGIVLIGLIDIMIPETQNPDHFKHPLAITESQPDDYLMRTGYLTALAIGMHNLPEGLATFGATLTNANLGVITAVAIAVHNIPEGISVSVPIFYATGNKNKAFFYSFCSDLTEPLGALIGYSILRPFLSATVLASLLSFIAGIMVYISLDQLLPAAQRYGCGHVTIIGVVLGMFVMALSLLIL